MEMRNREVIRLRQSNSRVFFENEIYEHRTSRKDWDITST
jgi:uncharacterized protein YegP (UPF0339 family)